MTTPTPPDLTGVHLKLERADQHITALDDEITEFGRDYITFELRQGKLDDSYAVHLHFTKPIPPGWGVVIGDICHNLRSALDHLVAALVVPPAHVHDRHQFPIFASQQAWDAKITNNTGKTMLDGVDPAHKAVVGSVQPYQPTTGLPRLAVLHRFSNADKHRLLHVAATGLAEPPKIEVSRALPMVVHSLTYVSVGQPIPSGSEVARFKAADTFPTAIHLPGSRIDLPTSKLSGNFQVNATIVFGEAGKEDTPVREFRRLYEDIVGVVKQFE